MSTTTKTAQLEDLNVHEKRRIQEAAGYARRLHPGPLGELAAREILAYAEFGYRFKQDALIPQLIEQIRAEWLGWLGTESKSA